MFKKIRNKWKEKSIKRIKRKDPECLYLGTIDKLAKLGEPEAVRMVEERNKKVQETMKMVGEEFEKKRYKEFYTGNITSKPLKRELKNLLNMEIDKEYSYDEISRMVNNIRRYRKEIIIFRLTWIGVLITIISAGITLAGLICNKHSKNFSVDFNDRNYFHLDMPRTALQDFDKKLVTIDRDRKVITFNSKLTLQRFIETMEKYEQDGNFYFVEE